MAFFQTERQPVPKVDTQHLEGQQTSSVPDTGDNFTHVPLPGTNCLKFAIVAMSNVKKFVCVYLKGSLDKTDAKSFEEVPNIKCHFTITKVGVVIFSVCSKQIAQFSY